MQEATTTATRVAQHTTITARANPSTPRRAANEGRTGAQFSPTTFSGRLRAWRE